MVESLREIVFNIDEQGKFTFLNRAWVETLGYSLSESLGLSFVQFLSPSEQEKGELILGEILKHKQTIRQELLFKHQNEKIVWLELSVKPNQEGGASGTLTDVTDRKQAIAKLEYIAYHDNLTGLYNRLAFTEELEQEIKRREQGSRAIFAVLFLDLDGFKLINDSLGHLIGDLLLIAVAKRLQGCLKATDTIARFGGDEFTILLSSIRDIRYPIQIAKRIHQILKQPFNLQEHQVFISTSIGIVLSTTEGKTSEDFLRNADIALYQAKAQGKAIYEIFDRKMHAQTLERLNLETYLWQALEKNEFEVYYQPIINLIDEQIVGFEALVRWHHFSQGIIAPAKFIPIAEETGLILDLGWWIFRQACQQMKQWQKQFSQYQSCYVSINLSIKQFSQPNLLGEIEKILTEVGLAKEFLKLEITESILMSNTQVNEQNLKQLQDLGIRLSIDDFGTGYSSLSYLHRFPLNTLKIDRSFINNIAQEGINQEIVEVMIVLAHKLGMDVIAEGVETIEQYQQLSLLGCDRVQGYFCSPPLSAIAVTELLSSTAPSDYLKRTKLTR
ncbi:response regulator receiver modulated diguanylate cyclase/phosphodiesterase with PAS/PAC sensor [Stanieria sp. NIES-3757]|nr:response regulator receiver modulated diguanylate cyclase/phosphodiesterase with PAS/PAC sensor [Stanieria sp. NIES-3757]